jgi:hypothetical protein
VRGRRPGLVDPWMGSVVASACGLVRMEPRWRCGRRARGRPHRGVHASAFDQAHLTGARTFRRFLLGEFDPLSLA